MAIIGNIYNLEFELAKKVSLAVGNFLNSQTIKKIDSQEGKDIKLELDRKSEEMILKALKKEFNYVILSEEIGLTKDIEEDKPYWIIDPIDGTLNFSRDNPIYCISIGFWKNKDPIFGVIYDFNRDELFSGYVEVGAWLNEQKLNQQDKKEKSQSVLATGFPTYMSDDETTLKNFIVQVQEYKKIRMIGSAALSLAYVACGRFDTYIESNIKLWDVAAGIAINKAIDNRYEIKYLENFETITKVGII
ncbi:MAG: inositol monophosphatase family protein [Arcobacteraceae bacterium]|jgi:myo-inositol-1(or 4)-monophosphatase|nr:inositol monophosphatase [Arcobacteraceae bacterium]MDY0364639.1 inositol monophosphatase family protein [Arcobacteraceae bacterium]